MTNLPLNCLSSRYYGVFQLESSGNEKLLLDMRPSVFEDIAILALYRPGKFLGSGMVEDFVQP